MASPPSGVGATFRSPAGGGHGPPIEIGGSGWCSRVIHCAGLGLGVAVRMAVLYLLARGKA